MARDVNWDLYQQLVDQLLGVVQRFIAREPLDFETLMAVLVLFQASLLTAPAMWVQDQGGDLEAFLAQYLVDIRRMLDEGIVQTRARGWHGRGPEGG